MINPGILFSQGVSSKDATAKTGSLTRGRPGVDQSCTFVDALVKRSCVPVFQIDDRTNDTELISQPSSVLQCTPGQSAKILVDSIPFPSDGISAYIKDTNHQ